ncbi:hypothetical protein D3C87_2081980 [compost metagenome]
MFLPSHHVRVDEVLAQHGFLGSGRLIHSVIVIGHDDFLAPHQFEIEAIRTSLK